MTLSVYMPESPFDLDKNEIKKAVKAIMNGRIKPEHINNLEIALFYPQMDDKSWHQILDGRGASKAYQDKIYSETMVMLLTLKAILIPKFLPDFLMWMQTAPKPDDCWESCHKLQASILAEYKKNTPSLPSLTRNINDGIYSLLSRLITTPKSSPLDSKIKHKLRGLVHDKVYIPQLVKATQSLLNEKQGLWSQFYRVYFANDLADALSQIPDLWQPGIITDYSEEKAEFLTHLQPFWKDPRKTDKKYLPLAQLFEELSFSHAAIFYQISTGNVPQNIFNQVSPKRGVKKGTLFEMTLIRQKGWSDHLDSALDAGIDFVTENLRLIRRGMVIGLLLVGGIGLTTRGIISLIANQSNKALEAIRDEKIATVTAESKSQQTSKTDTNNPETLTDISDENKGRFHRTNEAIKAMITNLTPDIYQLTPEQLTTIGIRDNVQDNQMYIVLFCVKRRLELEPEFQYGEIGKDNERWQEFSDAIRKYQEAKGANTPDGVIDEGGRTQKWLEEDIRNQCLNPPDGG
ncbi:hypothetical protein [Limnospira sp. PMC 289.06]|uniref:hypothetical protein n=1 Tax=Limnospira sp. PMC 289.06 TaxID=2981094 RepID=UPI0028E16B19|nr:hypothetical protein [Limnospira sp. PMC 289.06]